MATSKAARKRHFTEEAADETAGGNGELQNIRKHGVYYCMQPGKRLLRARNTGKTSVSRKFYHLGGSLELSCHPAAWDSEDIDHWKTVVIQPGEMAGPLLDESSFATLFPRYREKYLQQVWPHVTRSLKDFVSISMMS